LSARVTALVWSRYAAGGGEKLLALALADQCTDSGEYIAIDIARLAKKTSQADATVREQLRRMADDGWLGQMAGSKAFQISPEWLAGSAPVAAPAAEPGKAAKAVKARATRLTSDWELPEDFRAWALAEFPAWTGESVAKLAERFRDHWISASGQQASKVDWSGTWRNWCRREPAVPGAVGGQSAGAASGEWWLSSAAIDRKGAELGLERIDGEIWMQWRDRVFGKAGPGPWERLVYRSPSTSVSNFKRAGSNMAGELAKMRGATGAAGKV
jgi:hypothetical protein